MMATWDDDQLLAAISAGVRGEVDRLAPRLLDLSAAIYRNPELRFAEHGASALLRTALETYGFAVTPGVAGLPTAFRAEYRLGTGGATIAIFCEYDALPGLGHGCGHNIIAAAGLGAAVAAARWLAGPGAAGLGAAGRIVVLGSPGEEGGGGKVFLLEDGQLDDVDAAMMIHPAGYNAAARPNLGRMSLEARFTGRASHAAAAPEHGRNALDATTLLLVALGLLRQQLRQDSRIHAVVDEGGESVNIIPASSTVKIFVRSPDSDYLRGRLYEAVRDCVRGSALASGTTGVLEEIAKAYEPMVANPVLVGLVERAFAGSGRPLGLGAPPAGAGSTDMGNISRRVPSVHPYIEVTPGTPIHTAEFMAAAGSVHGDRATLDGATVLGTVAAVLLCRSELVRAARTEFDSAGLTPGRSTPLS